MEDNRFGLSREDIDRILDGVYWGIAGWLVLFGLLLLVAPERRFGSSWQFLLAIPGGLYIAGAANVTLGLTLLWAMHRHDRKVMARGMRIAGFAHWGIALFLLFGAVTGPTGVAGTAYALYAGAHMLVQSALLKTSPPQSD